MKKKIAVLACGWSCYFLRDFLDGLKKACEGQEIDIYIFNCYYYTEFSGYPNYTGFSIYRLIDYNTFDGVIVLTDLIGNQRILEKERLRILQAGIPAVSINANMNGLSTFRIDNYSGTYEAINHLIKEHGIRDLGHISGKESNFDISERYKAYRVALQENEIPIDMEKVFTIKLSNFNDAYEFAKEYFSSGKKIPQALVCASDLIALGVLQAAQDFNIRVPEDLKVIGFDDLPYSNTITPSLTTVRANLDNLGKAVLTYLLSGSKEIVHEKIPTTPVYRASCGCSVPEEKKDGLSSLKVLSEAKVKEDFSTQLDLLDEVFTEATDVFTLLTNLELTFKKSHNLEGKDFCIFLKSDWSSILINSEEKLPLNISYGAQVQSIVSIQDNVKYPREIINTKDLIPSKMQSGENNIYLFMPIFNHSYVHGYYVAKNNLDMIDNHYGYTWTRTFGNSIERFRKKNMYKQMSQQFLRLSTRDALSGALNRVGLEKLAKPYYMQNRKNGLTTVLFFVDINKMKIINDKYGHLHGDLAVKTVAAAAMEVIPKNWLPIRYGGDEFLIVGNSKNYNGEDYCKIITDRLAKKTAIMHLPYVLSASVGTYSVPPNSDLTLEQAVEKVDEIMYAKKEEMHRMMEQNNN